MSQTSLRARSTIRLAFLMLGAMPSMDQPVHDEGLNSSRAMRREGRTRSSYQLGAYDDDGASAVVHPLASRFCRKRPCLREGRSDRLLSL